MPADPLRRHYSRPGVAALLPALMPAPGARPRVLDLCCGSGRLGLALSLAWPGCRILGVDLDPDASPPYAGSGHGLVLADGFSLCPGDRHVPRGGFDAVVCNPPYGLVAPPPGLSAILSESGFAPHDDARPVDAALAFTAQSLRLARPGGLVALVLPDGLATGTRARGFREALIAAHGLEACVSLPRGAFDGADPTAHLLVIRRGSRAGSTTLYEAGPDGRTGPGLAVDAQAAAARLDRAFHATVGPARGPTLAGLGARAVRGRAAPGEGSSPAFHTSDFPEGAARAAVDLPALVTPTAPGEGVLAEPGDILVARVGRGLHRKVCLVASGRSHLTSFVLRVRLPRGLSGPAFRALSSPEGESLLRAAARGSGARMLAKDDLLSLPLPMAAP